MQIWTKKTNGRIIDIMYDGDHYTFNDRFMGLIAIATRVVPCEKRFRLEYGNNNNYYDSEDKSDALWCEAFIRKCETQYVDSDVRFDEVHVKCDNKYFVTLNVQER